MPAAATRHRRSGTTTEDDERLVARAIGEVVDAGRPEAIEDFWSPEAAGPAREWTAPLHEAIPDVQTGIVELVAEGGTADGHVRCSATHTGPWAGRPPTGRSSRDVQEVCRSTVRAGRTVDRRGLEDDADRRRRLGAGRGPVSRPGART